MTLTMICIYIYTYIHIIYIHIYIYMWPYMIPLDFHISSTQQAKQPWLLRFFAPRGPVAARTSPGSLPPAAAPPPTPRKLWEGMG